MEPTPTQPAPAPNSSTRRPLLYTDDLDRFDAISIRLGITGTAAHRFHALLEWAQQQLDGDPTQATVVLPVVSDQAKTLAWLTEEISSLRQQITAAIETYVQTHSIATPTHNRGFTLHLHHRYIRITIKPRQDRKDVEEAACLIYWHSKIRPYQRFSSLQASYSFFSQ